jgi:protocatechuate 3,4-dioxygenase beta subunit
VVETQPSGYNDGTENPGSGNTSTINDQIDVALLAGGDSPDNNYGELGATISGTVWIDTNRDGALTGETGRIPSVNIRLFDSSGTQVANTPTDASGYYHFDNLPPGSYTIVEDQPNIYGSTTPNGISVTITNTGSANNNFGEVLGSLAGYVYADLNNNGLREAGEPGIPATTITLTGKDLNGNPINQTAITAADGSYKFSDLPSGTYQTDETQPSGFSDGLDQAGTAGGSIITNDTISNIPLGAGVDTTEYDFGEIGVTISGTVWLDRNRDGILDTTEPGVGSVTLELRDNKGTLIRTITTNPDGSYVFVGLAEGVSYTITELQPTLYGSSTPNVITTPVLPSTGLTNQNFGETLGSVSGSVFIDNDDNGIRDPNEKGIPTTTITLTGKDLNGNPVTRTTMTDSNGNYRFNDLPAGTYTVLETQPVDYADGHDTLGNAGGTLINDQS